MTEKSFLDSFIRSGIVLPFSFSNTSVKNKYVDLKAFPDRVIPGMVCLSVFS